MRKKIIIPIAIIFLLVIGVFTYWYMPKAFLKGVTPSGMLRQTTVLSSGNGT